MRLLIHAGLPKTGSTYLQKQFVENTKFLQQHGVGYPAFDLCDSQLRRAGNAKQIHKWMLGGERLRDLPLNGLLKSISREADSILWSHEGLYRSLGRWNGYDIEYLRLIGIDRVSIIVFIRDLKEWAFSTYKQLCSSGKPLSISRFQEQWDGISSLETLLSMADSLEPVRIHAVQYDLVKPRLFSAFLKVSGINLPSGHAEASNMAPQSNRSNPSLSLRQIRLVQSIRRVHVGAAMRTSNALKIHGFTPSGDASGFERFWSLVGPEFKDKVAAANQNLATHCNDVFERSV